jgi:glycosyltransferase involved in cell wall biosynthesis
LTKSDGRASRPERVLLICRGWLDSVAIVTRFLNQVKLLQNKDGVQLYVAWMLDWSYLRDPARKQWVESIRREWRFPNVALYSLPLSGFGIPGRLVSAVFRVVPLLGFILRHRISIVHVHGFDGVQGLLVRMRRLLRVRCLLDMQGAVPEEFAYQGESAATVRRLEAQEHEAVEAFASIFCVSRKMVEHITLKHGVPKCMAHKFQIVPCCVPRALVGEHLERRQQLRRSLGLKDKFVVVYSGGTYEYQRVPEMCALFARIAGRSDDAFWLILSWGDHELFRRCLQEHGVDKRRFCLKNVKQSEVHDHLVAGDVGLLLREDHVLNRVSSPTKFAEYLAAGVPVISTPYVGDVSGAVIQENVGTIVDLPLAAEMDGMMEFLDGVRRQREAYTRRCLEFAEREWTWESRVPQFLRAIDAASRDGFKDDRLPRLRQFGSEPQNNSTFRRDSR